MEVRSWMDQGYPDKSGSTTGFCIELRKMYNCGPIGIGSGRRTKVDVVQKAEGSRPGRDMASVQVPDKTFTNFDNRKKSMTIENLLMMASGLECKDTYLDQWQGLYDMRNSSDWVKYVLDLPMSGIPGKRFEYCNGAAFLLSAIIRNASEMSTLDFAKQYFFTPLDIFDVGWETSPQGYHLGYGEMWLTPHDMAKIGWLYLNKGKWGNKQVIPSAWVETSTRGHIDATLFDYYGYYWWIGSVEEGNFVDYYVAVGNEGQRIFVVPEKNIVVAHNRSFHTRPGTHGGLFYIGCSAFNVFIGN